MYNKHAHTPKQDNHHQKRGFEMMVWAVSEDHYGIHKIANMETMIFSFGYVEVSYCQTETYHMVVQKGFKVAKHLDIAQI